MNHCLPINNKTIHFFGISRQPFYFVQPSYNYHNQLLSCHIDLLMSSKSGKVGLLTYQNSQWVCVVERGKDEVISSQAVIASEDGFPHDRVNTLMQGGKRVVQIAYGENVWIVVMQEEVAHDGIKFNQEVKFFDKFPEDHIQDTWKKGRKVVLLEHLNGSWVIVTEDVPNSIVVGQGVVSTTEALPGKELQDGVWNKNKIATSISYSKESGWLLLAELRSAGGQSYAAGSDWPVEKVADKLSKGMTIAGVAYNTEDEAWSVIFNSPGPKSTLNVTSTVHFETSFPEDLMRTLALTRYGKRF